MPHHRHRALAGYSPCFDVLIVALLAYLLVYIPYLLGALLLVGAVLWSASEMGHIWAGRPQGDLPAVLLLISMTYLSGCIYLALRYYLRTRNLLRNLWAQSLLSTRPFRRCDHAPTLSRFIGTPVCGPARGELTYGGESEGACSWTSVKGLLLTVFNRAYLIDWRSIDRLLPSASEAGIWLREGPLSGQEITIPWCRELEEGVPERLRQGQAVSGGSPADPLPATDGEVHGRARRNYLDVVIEGVIFGTLSTVILMLGFSLFFWLVFGVLLSAEFSRMGLQDPGVGWFIAFFAASIWVLAMHGLIGDKIMFLRWLEARALRSADRSQPVNSDEFRRRFVGEPILAKAKGLLVRHDAQEHGEVIAFNSGLLVVTSRRAYLLAWRDMQRVLPATDQATLVFAGPAGIPDQLSIPYNAAIAEVVPPMLLPGQQSL